MNNFIEYFYNIKIDKIIYKEKYYYFEYNGYVYKLYIYDDNISTNFLMEINKTLLGNSLISEIIFNRNNAIVSTYNGISYVLLKIYVNINKNISISEINYLSNFMYKEKINVNYGTLWSRKIDYLEILINENGKRYPFIVDTFNYFVGMAENAISYYNNILIEPDYKYVLSHKNFKFDDTVEALYNPMNIIFDYRVRDIAEYIKISFFKNKMNLFNEVDLYVKHVKLSLMEVKILISRLLYPSFYFDLYEDILIDDKDEKIIVDIISRIDEYEIYLAQIINYFNKIYGIDEIEWLKKRRFSN